MLREKDPAAKGGVGEAGQEDHNGHLNTKKGITWFCCLAPRFLPLKKRTTNSQKKFGDKK